MRVLWTALLLVGGLATLLVRWRWDLWHGRVVFQRTLRRMGLPPDAVRALAGAYGAGTDVSRLWRRGAL